MLDWWNDVELWLIQLPFTYQFGLVMAVLLPLCVVVAWFIDRVVDYASAHVGPARAERRVSRDRHAASARADADS